MGTMIGAKISPAPNYLEDITYQVTVIVVVDDKIVAQKPTMFTVRPHLMKAYLEVLQMTDIVSSKLSMHITQRPDITIKTLQKLGNEYSDEVDREPLYNTLELFRFIFLEWWS